MWISALPPSVKSLQCSRVFTQIILSINFRLLFVSFSELWNQEQINPSHQAERHTLPCYICLGSCKYAVRPYRALVRIFTDRLMAFFFFFFLPVIGWNTEEILGSSFLSQRCKKIIFRLALPWTVVRQRAWIRPKPDKASLRKFLSILTWERVPF